MTSSNGNIFRVTGHLRGNSPVAGEFPSQRPVTRSFGVFFEDYLSGSGTWVLLFQFQWGEPEEKGQLVHVKAKETL